MFFILLFQPMTLLLILMMRICSKAWFLMRGKSTYLLLIMLLNRSLKPRCIINRKVTTIMDRKKIGEHIMQLRRPDRTSNSEKTWTGKPKSGIITKLKRRIEGGDLSYLIKTFFKRDFSEFVFALFCNLYYNNEIMAQTNIISTNLARTTIATTFALI